MNKFSTEYHCRCLFFFNDYSAFIRKRDLIISVHTKMILHPVSEFKKQVYVFGFHALDWVKPSVTKQLLPVTVAYF